MKAYKIMLVALVIAEKEIFAVDRAIVLPPTFGLLDGLAFGMRVICKCDAVRLKVFEHSLFAV
jgi:hypothetical protein